MQAGDATIWADGLPRTGQRALEPAEIQAVKRAAWRSLTGGACLAAATLAGFASLFLLMLSLNEQPDAPVGSAAIGALFLLTTISSLILVGARKLKSGIALLRDCQIGVVEQFVERTDGGEDRSLEVLPCSGLRWSATELRVTGADPVLRKEIANLPAFARLAAEWVEPVSTRDGKTVHVSQRELTQAEIGEVRRLRIRLCAGPLATGALLAAWCLPVLAYSIVAGAYPPGHNEIAVFLLVIVTTLAITNAGKSLLLAGKLARDARLGRVGIMRYPEETAVPDSSDSALSAPVEVLPHCGILWSRAGQPAPWRVSA